MATVEVKKGKQKTRKEYVLRLTGAQFDQVRSALSAAKFTGECDKSRLWGAMNRIRDPLAADSVCMSNGTGEVTMQSVEGIGAPIAPIEVLEVPEGEPEEDEVTIKLSGSEARELRDTLGPVTGSYDVYRALGAAVR